MTPKLLDLAKISKFRTSSNQACVLVALPLAVLVRWRDARLAGAPDNSESISLGGMGVKSRMHSNTIRKGDNMPPLIRRLLSYAGRLHGTRFRSKDWLIEFKN